MDNISGQWLIFNHLYNKPKTQVWEVVSKLSGQRVGIIKWNSHWRRYWFEPTPEPGLGFDKSCLDTISMVIQRLMDERKK